MCLGTCSTIIRDFFWFVCFRRHNMRVHRGYSIFSIFSKMLLFVSDMLVGIPLCLTCSLQHASTFYCCHVCASNSAPCLSGKMAHPDDCLYVVFGYYCCGSTGVSPEVSSRERLCIWATIGMFMAQTPGQFVLVRVGLVSSKERTGTTTPAHRRYCNALGISL